MAEGTSLIHCAFCGTPMELASVIQSEFVGKDGDRRAPLLPTCGACLERDGKDALVNRFVDWVRRSMRACGKGG